jgi:alpha-1,2-mannosyltransferase
VVALTPRARGVLLALATLYAAVVIPIQLHKGGDLGPELRQSERLLRGEALYAATNRVEGVWWPPFSALALVPFTLLARASFPLAKIVWAIVSVACLAWSVAHVRAPTWQRVALATAAVAVPIQTNFEHANINTILLALVVAAAADVTNGREGRAGLWIGIATALKAFPGLLLAYLAYRRRWRAFHIGIGVAVGLTVLALLPHGAGEVVTVMREWLFLVGNSSDAVSGGNQSLAVLVSRLGASPAAGWLVALLCLTGAAVAFRPRPPHLPPTPDGMARELAVVTVLAVLLSPIAWVHYYVLLLPAWAVVFEQSDPIPVPRRPWWYAGVAGAALATSGLLTVGPRPLRSALLHGSIYAWGALLLLLLLFLVMRRHRPSPELP